MFQALPVGQGDSFLLRRKGGPTILVDGGRSTTFLPTYLKHLGVESIDIVVCTHADADHADGLIGLFEASVVPIKEAWLPGRWASRLRDLIADPMDWYCELAHGVSESRAKTLEEVASEGVTEGDPELLLNESDEVSGRRNEGKLSVVETPLPDLMEVFESKSCASVPSGHRRRAYRNYITYIGGNHSLWMEAIDASERIRSLAAAVHHHGTKVRWFDFDRAKHHGPSGGSSFLMPLNSAELRPNSSIRKFDALRMLALSVANRESLVFAAAESATHSGVVFTADSDMQCSEHLPAFSRHAIFTAPHHGSESNREAYQRIAMKIGLGNRTWVRSDGNYRKRPGAAFLRQSDPKACTLCRGATTPKREVILEDSASGWKLLSPLCKCG